MISYEEKRRRDNEGKNTLRRKSKTECLSYYSNTELPSCSCCGINNINVLTIDHINGNGRRHLEEIKSPGGTHTYRWLINNNYPIGYQTLCFNCNSGKNRKYCCPHKWPQEYFNETVTTFYYNTIRIPILKKFSNGIIECNNCKEKNILFLTIDHLNGGGKSQIRSQFNSVRRLYDRWLRDSAPIEDFQILCYNCNFLKHLNSI